MKGLYQLTAEQQAQLVDYALTHLLKHGATLTWRTPKKAPAAKKPTLPKRTWTKAQREAQAKRMMHAWKKIKKAKADNGQG